MESGKRIGLGTAIPDNIPLIERVYAATAPGQDRRLFPGAIQYHIPLGVPKGCC